MWWDRAARERRKELGHLRREIAVAGMKIEQTEPGSRRQMKARLVLIEARLALLEKLKEGGKR